MPIKTKSRTFSLRTNSVVNGDDGAVFYSEAGGLFQATRTRDGSALPGWRGIIRNGGNATTPLIGLWDTVEMEKSHMSWAYINPNAPFGGTAISGKEDGDTIFNNGTITPTYLAQTINVADADNGARAKFFKKLRQTAVQMSGPTFLGELRETLHMIRRPASALWSKSHGYLDALQKTKRSNPKAWLNQLSGLWLEHSFGWSPLIADCEDAMKAYERMREPRIAKGINVSFKDSKDVTSDLDPAFRGQTSILGLSGGRFFLNCRASEEANVRYKGALKCQAVATPWDNWALFGFTPTEFVPTAWELLPWSFLIDYFTNIGDILTSVVTDTSNVLYTNRTQRVTTTITGAPTFWQNQVYVNKGWNGGGSMSGGRFTLQRKVVNRGVGGTVSLPTFKFDTGLGNGQLLNIAALLGQAKALHPQRNAPHYHR